MRVHILRVQGEGIPTWIMFNKEKVLRGWLNESKEAIVSRWNQSYGKVTTLVRIEGICRASEAAMTIADYQLGPD